MELFCLLLNLLIVHFDTYMYHENTIKLIFKGSKMGHRRIYQFYSDVRQCPLFKKKRWNSVILFKSRLCIQSLQSKQLIDTHSALGIT